MQIHAGAIISGPDKMSASTSQISLSTQHVSVTNFRELKHTQLV